MKKDEIKEKAEKVFTFLYREGVSSSFRFPKGYGANILNSFADDLLKRENGMVSLGIVVDYCIHQAHLWRDADRWKNFSISWAFGKKGVDRFYNAKRGVRYYQDIWLKENNWSRDELKCKFVEFKEHPLKKFIYIDAEETTKKKMLNSDAGLALCITTTSLFSPKSNACNECRFNSQCEQILKTSNPELHRLRISNK